MLLKFSLHNRREIGSRSGSHRLEMFKKTFLDSFFPYEKRKAKVEEFINLRQRSMSVQEYSLKSTHLSTYAPSFVLNPRDDMSRFVTGVSNLVEFIRQCSMIP